MQNAYNKADQENNSQSADALNNKAYIFGSLFVMANRLQVLGDELDDKITLKQWLFISVIIKSERPALTISELSRLTGTSRQNAKKMAAILEREGYVAFVKDNIDARVLRVTLTEKCIDHFAKRAGLENQFITKLFNGIDSELIDKTATGFRALLNNISEMEKDIK